MAAGVGGQLPTVGLREFDDLTRDPGMDRNLLADDDPANDPPASVAAELAAVRTCAGEACP